MNKLKEMEIDNLRLKLDILKETLENIAEPRPLTGEDARDFQHWAEMALRDAGLRM